MQKEDISLLRIYAKNDMNCVKTAKEMDIHHNSVIYRLGKIKTETAGGPVVENFRLCEVVM